MEKLKIYAKTIEHEAIEQIYRMAKSEAYNDCLIRIMPDCHAGKGCTVGTAIKINNKIVPNTVGVDIGCGMLVCELGNIDIDLHKLDEIINTKVPYGFASHSEPFINPAYYAVEKLYCAKDVNIVNSLRQLGSLGGGNHFIEVNIDDENNKYLVIHSGSRHLGVEVCNYYQNIAYKSLNEMGFIKQRLIDKLKQEGREKDIQRELKQIKKPKCDKELAYVADTNATSYLHDMVIVQGYAALNRCCISDIICREMGWVVKDRFETIHNYVDVKSGILRKGAISARTDETLIIPINMRDGSLICKGLGNEDWLYSAPHGAGRLMSRAKAKELLSMEDYQKQMDGIYSTSICDSTIDEAPMAYKPIDEIIECIKPTVKIVKQIKPIYNFKAK